MPRRKPFKPIRRRIEITINGRHAKTCQDKITEARYLREVGESRLFTMGDTHRLRRTVAGVVIRFTYTAFEHLIREDYRHVVTLDLQSARAAIRANLAG